MTDAMLARHQTVRLRHETRRRRISVTKAFALTPKMLRLEFHSPDLHDFVSGSPDDHIKLLFPDAASENATVSRDYTPRAFDRSNGTLTIDFALHDGGVATDWARAARPGDMLDIGGPRGSAVIADDFDQYLLIGDETALPAIGRRVEEFGRNKEVTTVVVVDGPQDRQSFATSAMCRSLWAYRDGSDDETALRKVIDTLRPFRGDAFVWIAAEAQTAKALKGHFLGERSHPAEWLKSAGYWVRGQAGTSEK